MLALLTTANFLNYVDRYIFIALLPAIKDELRLSDVRVGLLGTAFMVAYFLTSPYFGRLGDRLNRSRLMAGGLAVWSAATCATGLMNGFRSLLGTRIATGIGEASYVAISPAVISDLYEVKKRGRAFSIYFLAMPVGAALGFVLGGLLEHKLGWRNAFWFAGIPGLLLTPLFLLSRDPKRGQYDIEDETQPTESLTLLEVCKELKTNRAYIYSVAGYTSYVFALGGIAFWIPHFLVRFHHIELSRANMLFGAVTVVAGAIGTMVGGQLADRWLKKNSDANLYVSIISAWASAVVSAGVLVAPNLFLLFLFVFIMEFFLFLSTSPINAQIVNCVPAHYRASGTAISLFVMHILGDAISPTLIGVISEASNLRIALIVGPVANILAGYLWYLGLSKRV